MDLLPLTGLFVAHFIGDFMLQDDRVANRKSQFIEALLYHVTLYSVPILLWALVMLPWYSVLLYVGLNWWLHFGTDYFTSRYNARMFQSGNRHEFFVGIGADQMLHMIALTSTYVALQVVE